MNATNSTIVVDAPSGREIGDVISAGGTGLKKLREGMKNCKVNLDDVFISKNENIRDIKTGYTDESIGELAAAIEGVGGLMQPIGICQVKPTPDTDNKAAMLVWGYRRCFALKMLAEDDPKWAIGVPAMLIQQGTESTGATRVVQLMENLSRKNISPMETAVAMNEVLEDKEAGFNQKELAIILGMSAPNVSQYLKLLRLPSSIRDMISSGNLQFSHAREILSRVPETNWVNVAKKAASMTFGAFQEYLDKEYPRDDSEEGDEVTSTGERTSSQKPAKMLRATDVTSKYVPFLKKQLDSADKANKAFTAADLAAARLDAVQTILLSPETQLAKDIKPELERIEAAELAEKAQEDSKKKEEAFFKDQVKRIEALYDTPVDTANPNAPRPVLAQVYAQVGKEIFALSPEAKTALGFKLPEKPDDLVQRLAGVYAAVIQERKESKIKRDKAKADKLAADAAAAGGTATTAAAPTTAG